MTTTAFTMGKALYDLMASAKPYIGDESSSIPPVEPLKALLEGVSWHRDFQVQPDMVEVHTSKYAILGIRIPLSYAIEGKFLVELVYELKICEHPETKELLCGVECQVTVGHCLDHLGVDTSHWQMLDYLDIPPFTLRPDGFQAFGEQFYRMVLKTAVDMVTVRAYEELRALGEKCHLVNTFNELSESDDRLLALEASA